MIKKILLSLLTLAVISPTATNAQSGGQTTTIRIKTDSISLFPRNYYTLAFFNDPRISESDFTIRFRAYGVVAGCASMAEDTLPEGQEDMYKNIKDGAQIKYVPKKLKIAILDRVISLDEEDPRYTPHDCSIKHNESFVDIPLNRDNLIKRGIEKIKLDSIKYGDFGEHEIEVDESRVTLKLKSWAGEYWPTFWFFPSNSIVLKTTSAKHGEDVTEMIREFGISHGLIPMEDVLEDYKLPHTAKDYVYFTDPSRRFLERLNDETPSIFVGKINPTRTIYGVDGPRELSYAVDVMASHAVSPQPE